MVIYVSEMNLPTVFAQGFLPARNCRGHGALSLYLSAGARNTVLSNAWCVAVAAPRIIIIFFLENILVKAKTNLHNLQAHFSSPWWTRRGCLCIETTERPKPPSWGFLSGKFMTTGAIHHRGFSGDTLSFYKQTLSLPDTSRFSYF